MCFSGYRIQSWRFTDWISQAGRRSALQHASTAQTLSKATSDASCVRTAIVPTRQRPGDGCQAVLLQNCQHSATKDFILQMRFGHVRGLQAENKKQVYRIQQNREAQMRLGILEKWLWLSIFHLRAVCAACL